MGLITPGPTEDFVECLQVTPKQGTGGKFTICNPRTRGISSGVNQETIINKHYSLRTTFNKRSQNSDDLCRSRTPCRMGPQSPGAN